MMITLGGPFEAALDGDGYPIIDSIELKGGSIVVQELRSDGFELAAGQAAAEIGLSKLPIEGDREPPIVARPDLTPEELAAAPTTLEFGDKTLVFTGASVSQSWGSATVTLCFQIKEMNLNMFDEVRMDFVWVVRESDVWEPAVSSIWNNYEFGSCAQDGPNWPVAADVDVVVGFVDMDGVVQLMKATTSVKSDF